MTWWTYVEGVANTSRQRDIAERAGVDETNVTRWKNGQVPGPAMVARFARAYGQPVLKAFIEAGFLTAEEAGERPAATPSLDSLSDDELLDEIRQRLSERGATNDASQEQGSQAGGTPQQSEAAIAADRRARAAAVEEAIGVNPITDAPVPRSKRRPVSESDGRTTGNKRAGGGGRR